MTEFTPNIRFEEVFYTEHRFIDIWGGRGRGGSHFGTDYFLYLIIRPEYFRGYFIREKFADIRDSLFRDFKDRVDENPHLRIQDFRIQDNEMRITYLPTGNQIISKGVSSEGKRTAKMKSLAGATHVLMEEADEVSETDFNQMDLSLRTTKVKDIQIIRIFNPPTIKHWIWKKYNLVPNIRLKDPSGEERIFYSATPKSDSDILSIHTTYHDNIDNINDSTRKQFESFRQSDEHYYYNQIKGLITDGERGQIYTNWKPISLVDYNALQLPHVYGLDFGYSIDPNALVQVKYDAFTRYHKEIIYQSNLDDVELAMRMRDCGVTPNDLICADIGNGGDVRIATLRKGWGNTFKNSGYPDLRFNIHPVIKGRINVGITKVKGNRNHFCETSMNLQNEVQKYKWAIGADKNLTDTPIDKFNHLLDALRYVEVSRGRLF